ncbi:MAG: alpha/beta hydrolase [Bacillota bacterium]
MEQGWQWQKVKVKNQRGLRLAGLMHGSPAVTGKVVIIAHGFTGSKEGGGRAVAMAENLGSLGYGALLFDFAGCGESEGEFKDVSLTNHIADLRAVFDYGRSIGFPTIILVGRSFGGDGALCFAAMEKEVAGVCAWATPANPWQLFNHLFQKARRLPGGILELAGDKGQVLHLREEFLADLAKYDIKQAAARIGPRPLLILHGDRDELVPVTDAHSLAEAAFEPKHLIVVPGGDHQFSGHYQEAYLAVADWLKRWFPPA